MQSSQKKNLALLGAKPWWNNVCNAFKIQRFFYSWHWFRFTFRRLTTRSSISVNVTIICRRKILFLNHLIFMCSHPISHWTTTASEQGLVACLLSIFHIAPCSQHRHEQHLHFPPRKNTLAPYCPTTIHIHHYTHKFLYCKGHLILDQAQLVNSWHHREHLCETSNRNGTCQRAAVNT